MELTQQQPRRHVARARHSGEEAENAIERRGMRIGFVG
jgi:hypothetical protein